MNLLHCFLIFVFLSGFLRKLYFSPSVEKNTKKGEVKEFAVFN